MYGRTSQDRGDPTPPVRVGERLTVTIEAVGEKGDGIAKKNGFVLFIPGVKEGQQVTVEVTKVLRKVGFAKVASDDGSAPSEEAPEVIETVEEVVEEAPAESAEDSETFGEEPVEEVEEPAEPKEEKKDDSE